MIPLRDINPRRTPPIVNTALIVINVLFFLWELSLGPELQSALMKYAFIPARFSTPGYRGGMQTVFISMFLHGGWLHLAGNMLYLWIFGDNIEDRLGHAKYLFFYLACGVIATYTHAFMNLGSRLPSIGASGAIAGVLGAYIVLFPTARVMTFIPIGFFLAMRELPALLVLGFWFVMQLFVGVTSLGTVNPQDMGGVAYFAHIGGFVAGIILVLMLGGRRAEVTHPRF